MRQQQRDALRHQEWHRLGAGHAGLGAGTVHFAGDADAVGVALHLQRRRQPIEAEQGEAGGQRGALAGIGFEHMLLGAADFVGAHDVAEFRGSAAHGVGSRSPAASRS